MMVKTSIQIIAVIHNVYQIILKKKIQLLQKYLVVFNIDNKKKQ